MRVSSLLRRAGAVVAGFSFAFAVPAAHAGVQCTCTGDYDGSGRVDGADLGILLSAWNTNNSAIDLTGNGYIDGADLGILLASWGPCQGPENDACSAATSVFGEHVYEFCNLYAGTDGPALPPGSCESATNIYNDVWYRFDATSTGLLTLNTCLGNANWDTVLAVYGSTLAGISPCPTSGASLAPLVSCSDDTPNTFGCTFTESYLSLQVNAGHSYKIRVGGAAANDRGTGFLSVQYLQYGASCEFPVQASNSQSIVEVLGTTIDNDVAGLPATCFGSQPQGPTEWISYTATCTGTLSISTCHPNTDYDTVLYVMLDSPAGGNCWDSVLGCNDDSAAPGCQLNGLNRRSRVDVHVNSGAVVKIAVSGFNGASGNYGLVITRVCD